jgi:hypothetical protein
MSAVEKKYDTTQDDIWFLQQLLRCEVMPFPGVHFIKKLGIE